MNFDKYLKLIKWAKNRYTVNGFLVVSVGHVLTRYSVIECLAAKKYLKLNVGIILIPIAYSKYMIYAEAKRIQSLPEVKNNEVVMKQPQFQNTPLNGSAKNEADVLNSLASGGLPLANF